MKEFELKYGCNPNQKPSKIFMESGNDLPIEILNGKPGYINFLDAFNSWRLVKEIKDILGMPAATSFKHVSPTSANSSVLSSLTLLKRLALLTILRVSTSLRLPVLMQEREELTECHLSAIGLL